MKPKFLLLLFVTLSILPIHTQGGVPESSLMWSEGLLTKASQTPLNPSWEWAYHAGASLAEDAFTEVLRKHGPDSRAYIGLGHSQFLLGKYGDAADSFSQALRLSPHYGSLDKELQKAKLYQQVSESASRQLGTHMEVLQVVNYPLAGPDVWLSLSASVSKDKDSPWPTYNKIRLSDFQGKPSDLHLGWQSDILGFTSWTDGEFNDVGLFVVDVTGDSHLDVVIPEVFFGGSWTPSHLDVFEYQYGELVKILGVRSDEPLQVEDINHDGKYEVINSHAVGHGLAHVEQPRWTNIYAYKNGTYQLANGDFPRQFDGLYREIRRMLVKYPDDYELLRYLGDIYAIRKQPSLALQTYKKAEASWAWELKDEKDPDFRASLMEQITYLHARILKLTR